MYSQKSILIIVLFRVFQLISPLSGTAMKGADEELGYRLPSDVIPSHYNVKLDPQLGINSTNFKGVTQITIYVNNSTERIVLHSNGLIYENVALFTPDNLNFVTTFALIEDSRDYIVGTTDPPTLIPTGEYLLHFEYTGPFDGGLVGFYRSSSAGRVMAASKFQPTYARQAFPCFDEPALKATFNISLVKPTAYSALSNMNVMSVDANAANGTDTVHFATSVPMSTYLACFVVCDYKFEEQTIETHNVGQPFTLRAYARDTDKITFALDIGKRATEFYIQYYQVPFPLPKLDMIAIPDYVSGATEHWGLITYRETSLLIDAVTTSSANKVGVANTIAHELAHMWFGNLVTMKWWDEVWLNEGFATYMQVKALNAIEPSWAMLDQFLTKTLHHVLATDSKLSSHPIVQDVTTPDQITAIFDTISYNKGSSVLRMVEGFIGASGFQSGITDYLNKHKYGVTVTENLLDALEPHFLQNNAHLNLRYILDTWTRQSGYPLVTVSHGKDPFTLTLTQTRYLADPTTSEQQRNDSKFNYRWYVPITYKTLQGAHNQTLWFPDTSQSVDIVLNEDSSWIKVNNDQVGYYRVNYPQDIWDSLLNQLQTQSDKLTISDRAELLDDIFALATSRHVTYELALKFSTYLKQEREYVPWAVASSVFSDLMNKLRNTPAHEPCQRFIQSLVSPLYANMSWEPQSTNTVIYNLLRVEILHLAGSAGLRDARDKARQMFLQWLSSRGSGHASPLDPDLKTVIYYYGMRQATSDEWDALWQVYLAEQDAQERKTLIAALAMPEDASLLARYLELSWSEDNVRGQDYLTVLHHISANPAGKSLVWDHVRLNWHRLVERFTLNSRYLGALIPAITHRFHTDEELKEMEDFFAQHPNAGAGETARKQALETVGNNIKWMQYNLRNITAWLDLY